MLAIVVSYSMILIWMLTGLGLFKLMRFYSSFYLRLLLAPAVGVAVNIVVLFTLSRIGLPIKLVAIPLLCIDFLLAGYFLIKNSRFWKHKDFFIFCLFLAGTLIPFSWVFFKFGFEWLAFVNGDMSFYSLSSARFLNYGYSELPISGDIYDDKDHSLAIWFLTNIAGHRAGADLLLAHVVGVTGLTAHQAFMPLIIACHACIAAGAGALALLASRRWSAALWAIGLASLSPLLTYGVILQLLAQTIGLVFLTCLCVSYLKGMENFRCRAWSFVTVILFCGLAIAYSEVVPFFGLFVLAVEFTRWKKWMVPKTRNGYLRIMSIFVLSVLLVLNSYIIDIVHFIMLSMDKSFQSGAMTMKANGISLFPYFLTPLNGALLWGWVQIGGSTVSLVLLLGFIATILYAGAATFLSLRHGVASAQMSIIMLIVAVSMYIGRNGFGLLKISMFLQPFLIATCVVLSYLFLTRRLFQLTSLTLLGLSFIPVQTANIIKMSANIGPSPVAFASRAQIGKQLRELSKTFSKEHDVRIYSDSPIRELFLLQAYYFKGVAFETISLPSRRDSIERKYLMQGDNYDGEFYFAPDSTSDAVKFYQSEHISKEGYLLTATREFGVINRANSQNGMKLIIKPVSEVSNHLVFKQTSLGNSYFGNARDGIVLSQLEKDPLFKGDSMSAVGRYHLYEVLGSKEGSRMQLSVSASFNKREDFRLPFVKITGSTDTTLPLVGRGSARLVSFPISPRKLTGADYLGIDFGREGSFLERERRGVMGLFGKNVRLDIRKTVVSARDISYISSEQYAAFKRPQVIQSFPDALMDPDLEYSGFFEDGWMSEVAFAVLKSPANGQQAVLNFSGLIPDIEGAPFHTTLTIKVNDKTVYTKLHFKGYIKVAIPVGSFVGNSESARIQIESSALQRLPNGDDRPVSLRLSGMTLL